MHAPEAPTSGRAADTERRGPRNGARPEENRLLRALPPDEYERVLELLEPVELALRQVLWYADTPIRSVYFPRTAVVSLITTLAEDAPVEAATVGREGMVGTPIALGVGTTRVQAIAQVAGTATRMDASHFREFLHAPEGTLFPLVLRYAQALQEQTSQSVACNRRHGIDERCARWLLMTQDRAGADRFHITHDFLAFMLGVRRASVTVAAGMLQQAGLIRYSRGRITVLDREGLERASCECYAAVRHQYELLLGPQPSPA